MTTSLAVALALALTLASSTHAQSQQDTLAFAALEWRSIGPARGGRSVAVAGSAARPNEYWMGTTGGGVFKTTDGGLSWAPVTDRHFGGTIGGIAVSESNPDVVYVGTGEYPIRGNVSHGDGVYRSGDGGRSWRYVGLAETRQIARVRVHPKNPDVVYVAALGHAWAPNPDRGVYRSADGGKSWTRILFRDDSTGAIELALDPSNPSVLYAGFWQAGRKPWQLVSGGRGSGIFKSTDGGERWTEVTRKPGLPKGLIGNVGLAVSPAKSSIVWAIIEADSGGVFRSGDGGETWTRVNDERKLRQRAWYYTKIYADPKDTNTVYVSNVRLQRSTDGGRTFSAIETPHGDSHDLWIAPDDSQRLIEGNDGGANVSRNGGKTWTGQAYPTAQFYHVSTTTHFPYHVCGAQQDNSTLCGPSRGVGGIRLAHWRDAGGCESGYVVARPDDPEIVYAGCYGGMLTRKDLRSGFERNISVWPVNPMGNSAADLRYRFQWTFPIVVSPHDPATLYAGGNVVFRSRNEGQSWEAISPDLTRHEPATLGPSGGPITRDQTSVEYYGTVFTIAESPREAGVIWAGSDDGLIHVTRDGGTSWTNVTPKELAPFTRISLIEASAHKAGTALVAANRYQLDDLRPYLWRTDDYGQSWRRIDAGIAPTEFTRVVREDPERPDLLYAGTERGVWVSFDGGGAWRSLQRNLPPVPVHDLAVAAGDLVAATHGRSFWIFDDLSVLRQFGTEQPGTVHLYRPREAHRVQWDAPFADPDPTAGRNPPSGAAIYYTLPEARRTVQLEISDSSGAVLRRFSSEPDSLTLADSLLIEAKVDSLVRLGVEATSIDREELKKEEERKQGEVPRRRRAPRVSNREGLNRFVWDLRSADATDFEGLVLWFASGRGPVVPPGTYSVRLTVGKETRSQPFTVRKDPRSKATDAELAEQYALLVQIRDRTSAAHEAVIRIRGIRSAVVDRRGRAGKDRGAAIERAARPLLAQLEEIENTLYQTKLRSSQDPLNYPIRLNNQVASLAGVAASSEGKPTAQTLEAFRVLSERLDRELARLDAALGRGLPPVNAELRRAGLAPIE
ncbi:MAG TPA: glycosyl hydrolase [Gemmatimonadales bacterium]|nr:glycosyl hydrolase [Gemmatimonadales bacterium]